MHTNERSQSENAIYYTIPTLTLWKRQNHGDGKKNNRKKGGEINKHSTEDLKGSETTLYDTVMMDACHCIFVKTRRLFNIKSEWIKRCGTSVQWNITET